MRYSTKAIRRGSIFILTLIGLLQALVGPASVRRERVSAAKINIAPRLDHERSLSHTPKPGAGRKTKSRVSEAYGRLPIRFEANVGQTDAAVKFLSRGGGHSLFLTQSEAVLTLRRVRPRGDGRLAAS